MTRLKLAAMAIVVSTTVTGMPSVQAQAQSDHDELRAVERERLRSLVQADMKTADQLHADDFQLVTWISMRSATVAGRRSGLWATQIQ